MNIEIKKSIKPVNYFDAINILESRLKDLYENNEQELIWTLEHNEVFTAGTSYKENEIIDKSIKILETNRGGKITYHGPGQLICYFVLDLRKKKDIRKFITIIEKTIIQTLKFYKIETFPDKDNIGIWYKYNNEVKKIAAIGIRVSKWIAYHGFAININNNLENYKKIIPCGISDKGVTNLKTILDQDYSKLEKKITENFILNLKNYVHQGDFGNAKCPKFNLVGPEEIDNLSLAEKIANAQNKELIYELIDNHSSRPGHDLRYSLSSDLLKSLGWEPKIKLSKRIEEVVDWSLKNNRWLS